MEKTTIKFRKRGIMHHVNELQNSGMSTEEIQDLIAQNPPSYEERIRAVRELERLKQKVKDNEENGRDVKHDR